MSPGFRSAACIVRGIAFAAATLNLRIGVGSIALLVVTVMVKPARGTTNWWVEQTKRWNCDHDEDRHRGHGPGEFESGMVGSWRREPDWLARLSFLPQSFEAVDPLVENHKRPSRATGGIAA